MKSFTRLCFVWFLFVSLLVGCGGASKSDSRKDPDKQAANKKRKAPPENKKKQKDKSQQGKKKLEKIKIGFVVNNPTTFWAYTEAGCAQAVEDFDVDVIFRLPAQPTPQFQNEIIDDLLERGCKGVAVSVIAPKLQREHLKKVAKKVLLITVGTDAPKSGRVCHIGTDNYEAGWAAGQLVKSALGKDGGKVALFVGQIETLNAQQRRDGILDALAGKKRGYLFQKKKGQITKIGKYTLLAPSDNTGVFTDVVDLRKARNNVSRLLQKHPNPKNLCLVGLWAYNPPAILSAVKEAGQLGKVKIVGFDEEFETLKGVAKGHIEGTVIQDPYKYGYESVRILAKFARGKKEEAKIPKNGIVRIPHVIVNRSNVAKVQKKLQKILKSLEDDSKAKIQKAK